MAEQQSLMSKKNVCDKKLVVECEDKEPENDKKPLLTDVVDLHAFFLYIYLYLFNYNKF